MQPLSALEAIRPAWDHTRDLLYGRRDVRLLLKLTAVAFFAELGGGFNFNVGSPGRLGHGLPSALAGVLVPLLILLGGLVLSIALVMFYVGSRLQFVLFDVVLRGQSGDLQVRPLWLRYGPATWRWIGFKLLFVLGAVVCLAPIALPAALLFVRAMPRHGGRAPALALIAGALALIAVAFAILLLLAAVFVLLRDFGLPSMALEATPLRETARRVARLVRLEPGQVSLFVVMRCVLGLAGTFASYALLFAGALAAAVPLGGVALGLWAALHRGSLSGRALMFAGWGVLGVGLAAVLVMAAMVLFGYVFTFLQAYAIFFLAGRYRLVAEHLRSAVPVRQPRAAWPPAFYPPPQPPPL